VGPERCILWLQVARRAAHGIRRLHLRGLSMGRRRQLHRVQLPSIEYSEPDKLLIELVRFEGITLTSVTSLRPAYAGTSSWDTSFKEM